MMNIPHRKIIAALVTSVLCTTPSAWAQDSAEVVEPIVTSDAQVRQAVMSPSGRYLAYVAGETGNTGIFVLDMQRNRTVTVLQGGGDYADVQWFPDSETLVFASDRAGTWDIWTTTRGGAQLTQITELPGRETQPTVSPYQHTFNALGQGGCGFQPFANELQRFWRIAFTSEDGNSSSIMLVTDGGDHLTTISPVEDFAFSPFWANDADRMGWIAERPEQDRLVRVASVSASRDLRSAIGDLHVEFGDEIGCEEGFDEIDDFWPRRTQCELTMPVRYVRAQEPVSSSLNWDIAMLAFNQTRLTGISRESGRVESWQPHFENTSLPIGQISTSSVSWNPDGRTMTVVRDGAVWILQAKEYLSDVANLDEFPEFAENTPNRALQGDGLTIQQGEFQEFYEHYESLNYAERPVFITIDTMLAALHDDFALSMINAERAWQRRLPALMTALENHALGFLTVDSAASMFSSGSAAESTDASRQLAVAFSVARVLLQGMVSHLDEQAAGIEAPDYYAPVVSRSEPPVEKEMLEEQTRILATTVDDRIREDVARCVNNILSAANEEDCILGTRIDFSQFRVRSHYAEMSLDGYFQAYMWLALIRLPAHQRTIDLLLDMPHMPVDAGVCWGLVEGQPCTAQDVFRSHDAFVSGHLSTPVRITPSILMEALNDFDLLQPIDIAELQATLRRSRVGRSIRGYADAVNQMETLDDGLYGHLDWGFFARRHTLDSALQSALSYPAVERILPSALDVFALRENSLARTVILGELYAEGSAAGVPGFAEELVSDYDAVIGEYTDALDADDLYHRWLQVLRDYSLRGWRSAPDFVRTPGWQQRRLLTALAGYAVLRHDSQLYAEQAYANQCDGSTVYYGFVERIVEPTPGGFIEPEPERFRELAELADHIHATMRAHDPSLVNEDYRLDAGPPLASLCRRLATMAERQAEEMLSEDSQRWIYEFATELEYLLRGEQPIQNVRDFRPNGVILTADFANNVMREETRYGGVGHVMDLFVAVPFGQARRLTQGGMYSYYEFVEPMSPRLTDDEWALRVRAGGLSLPDWVTIETTP